MFDEVRTVRVRVRRPPEIVVGNTYFLSGFQDVSGAYVKVLEKPTDTNKLWWNSKVKVEVLVEVGDIPGPLYKAGNITTVHTCNLYKRREDAAPKRRHPQK
jgi:hypothetical protein